MARGQVTVEFVLILIIVLVIISTVSIPLINYASDTLTDTGNAVMLGQVLQRIKSIADSISMSGCGSYQKITIDKNQLDSAIGAYKISVYPNSGVTEVSASYYLQNGTKANLNPIDLPSHVLISNNGYTLKIYKDCSGGSQSSITLSGG